MEYLNKQIKALYHITEQDYLNWCEKHKKSKCKKETKQDFLSRLNSGRLVKDTKSNKMLVKRPRG